MERSLLYGFFIIIFATATFSKDPTVGFKNFDENEEPVNPIMASDLESASYEKPSFLFPVYLRIVKDLNDTYSTRDDLKITIGKKERFKRSTRRFTRFNSTTTTAATKTKTFNPNTTTTLATITLISTKNVTPSAIKRINSTKTVAIAATTARFNSTPITTTTPVPRLSTQRPTKMVQIVTTHPKPLFSEPLIMIRNLATTKSTGTIKIPNKNKTISTLSIFKVQKAGSTLKPTTATFKKEMISFKDEKETLIPKTSNSFKNKTENIKKAVITVNSSVTTSTTKRPAKRHPEPPNPPPTGDISEEDDDEEDEEDDDEPQADNESDGSSEEEDEEKKPTPKPQTLVTLPTVAASQLNNQSQTPAVLPSKGDNGSTDLQSDKSVKKHKKKSKKKKGKKAQLHFIPKPLGPKAELMIRLDKVHKNVREIFSVVKGVFTDFVVQRPHVNIEVALKGEKHPHEKEYQHRSEIFHPYQPEVPLPFWNPPSWRRNRYPNPMPISKRVLETEDCSDDESCEYDKPSPPSKKQKRPFSIQKIQLPYPIYMESNDGDSHEYSPFDDLPPLSPTYFESGEEKTWVKTWDKKKNGLPKLAGSAEASKRVRHRPRPSQSDFNDY